MLFADAVVTVVVTVVANANAAKICARLRRCCCVLLTYI